MMARDDMTRGFTLLELLVALFVAAVMFGIGYAGVAQAARHRASVLETQQSLAEVQRAVRILTRDLAELDPRPVRDELGRGERGAFVFTGGSDRLIEFTRGGRNPTSLHARGSLQRIEYALENGSLVRRAYAVLDRTQDAAPLRRVLMRGVRSVSLRYLDARGEWVEVWPITTVDLPAPTAVRARPRAIELIIDTEREGRIRRLVEVPG